jgi:lysozyme family protein
VVGPRTLAAIRARDPDDVYRAYYQARLQFYRAIVRNRPDQKVFERGWLRRLNRYRPAELPA